MIKRRTAIPGIGRWSSRIYSATLGVRGCLRGEHKVSGDVSSPSIKNMPRGVVPGAKTSSLFKEVKLNSGVPCRWRTQEAS